MPIYTYSPDQVLLIGLRIAGFKERQIKQAKRKSNLDRFGDSYGVDPIVYCQIWKDLQTTDIPEARIDTTKPSCTIITFLQAIRFLKKYDTEKDREGQTNRCDKFCRDWGWYFLDRVAALRGMKVRSRLAICLDCSSLFADTAFCLLFVQIVFPNHFSTVFTVSLDGVHCHFHEVKHPILSKNPQFYSHKFHGPGVGYQLALSLFTSDLVYLKGPDPAGQSDMQEYQAELKDLMPDGKKIVVDGGYNDKADKKLSRSNANDDRQLRKFKARAKARQESFHSRVKRFESVATTPFRHGMDRHKTCFEAICVICQYEMELVSPLFDI